MQTCLCEKHEWLQGLLLRCELIVAAALQVLWPMGDCNKVVLRLVPDRAAILNSRERAPFLLFVEMMQLPDSSSEDAEWPLMSGSGADVPDAAAEMEPSPLPAAIFTDVASGMLGSGEFPPVPAQDVGEGMAEAAVALQKSPGVLEEPAEADNGPYDAPEDVCLKQGRRADVAGGEAEAVGAIRETSGMAEVAAMSDPEAGLMQELEDVEAAQALALETSSVNRSSAAPLASQSGAPEAGPSDAVPMQAGLAAFVASDFLHERVAQDDIAKQPFDDPSAQQDNQEEDAALNAGGHNELTEADLAQHNAAFPDTSMPSGDLSRHRVPSEEALLQMVSSMHADKLAEPRDRGLHMCVMGTPILEAASRASSSTFREGGGTSIERDDASVGSEVMHSTSARGPLQPDDAAAETCDARQPPPETPSSRLKTASSAATRASPLAAHDGKNNSELPPAGRGTLVHKQNGDRDSSEVPSGLRNSPAESNGSWVNVDRDTCGSQMAAGSPDPGLHTGMVPPLATNGDKATEHKAEEGKSSTVAGLPKHGKAKRRWLHGGGQLTEEEVTKLTCSEYVQHVHGAELGAVTAQIRVMSPYGKCDHSLTLSLLYSQLHKFCASRSTQT
jgi:hypothetical protein